MNSFYIYYKCALPSLLGAGAPPLAPPKKIVASAENEYADLQIWPEKKKRTKKKKENFFFIFFL
jgi:hypothetical protein